MDYDCSPKPKPEPVVHHAIRAVHNWLHPQHKHVYIAPIALSCKMPDMETITITADSDTPNLVTVDGPQGYGYGYGGGGGSDYGGGYLFTGTPDIGVDAHNYPPVSVPEPPAILLALPLLFMYILFNFKMKRMRSRRKSR